MNKIFFILLLFSTTSGFCQENSKYLDSTTIVSFTDKIFVKFHLDTETDSYIVENDHNQNLQLNTNN